MKPIGSPILVAAIVLTAMASPPREAPSASPPEDASRAATFVGLRDGETLFVERVRDATGGFHGEVSVTGGSVWIRYRVELGPDESIRRYELDMAPPGPGARGAIPGPLLVARRVADSIFVEPEPGSAFPGARVHVPPGAFMGSTEMAVFEQAIRFGLRRGGSEGQFPIVSAWTGKRMVAQVARTRNKVSLRTTMDTWEFTMDTLNRIVSGVRIEGPEGQAGDPWRGLRVVRLDPARPAPIHEPLTIGESEEGRRRDRLDARMQTWARRLASFRHTLASGLPARELAAALDGQILAFADHGGVYQSERCLEAVAALRGRPGGDTLAVRYARRAVACADAHDVRSFGEQGMMEARVKSRAALAEALAGHGRRDTAIVLLEATQRLPRPYDPPSLRRDVLRQLGELLAAEQRTDEALEILFEAVAVDDTPRGTDERLQSSLAELWRRRFPDDTTIASRIDRADGLNSPTLTMGGGTRPTKGAAAPAWSGRDLGGRLRGPRAGRPLVVVFWGGWSEPGRRLVRLAEQWHRRRGETHVDVVSFDWELPGPGPFSERLARRAVRSENLTLPVLLDLDREVWRSFRGEAFPQVFFVDREGRITRTVFGGVWGTDALSAWVEALGRGELR